MKQTDIAQETAEQIATHMKAALELDPENKVIKKTNADRMKYGIGNIETRIARGEFPVISRLRKQFGIEPLKEETNEHGTGDNT